MKTTSFLIASAMLLCGAQAIYADDSEPKFKVTPTGRILLDGALYASPQKEEFKDGMAIPDARLGVKMTYGKWTTKIDVGFAYGKVGLKDLWMQYTFDQNQFLRIGSFIHQFGLQSATSSSMKPSMEEPESNGIFNDSRQIGLMYEYSAPKFLATASVHVEPKATTLLLRPDQFLQEGYGFRTRLAARPIAEEGKVVQVGVSGAFGTPQNGDEPEAHDSFSLGANFPTRVVQVSAVEAKIDHARNIWKLSPELLLNYGPVALESQYYLTQIKRRDGMKHFTGQGAYAMLRGLILGGDYGYSPLDGGLATPKPGSLELVGLYNYSTITDPAANVFGGRVNTFSVTANYYINKYMIVRLHYGYTHTWDRIDMGPKTLNAFMARLQVIF